MNHLYLDIETIPTQNAEIEAEIRANIKPPGSMKKQETIDKWWSENGNTVAEEAYRKTALDGTHGEIICVTFGYNDQELISISRSLGESEADLLADFYDEAINVLISNDCGMFTRVIHGSKSLFDLNFLYKRSVILRQKPTFDLCHDRRANCEHVFDTMTAWAGWGNYVKLDVICQALGIESPKGKMEGSQVWDYVQAGKIAEVVEYNRADVEALREVYKRLNFIGANSTEAPALALSA